MRRGLMILIGAVLLGLVISWAVMSQMPADDELTVQRPSSVPFSGTPSTKPPAK